MPDGRRIEGSRYLGASGALQVGGRRGGTGVTAGLALGRGGCPACRPLARGQEAHPCPRRGRGWGTLSPP